MKFRTTDADTAQVQPPGEDGKLGPHAVAIPALDSLRGMPPGEDGFAHPHLENEAALVAANPDGVAREDDEDDQPDIDFLHLVREAEQQALLYTQQVNRKAWSVSLRAFHQEHPVGSKYTRPEWRGRSRVFVPKTRTAVRKDNAAVAASLFNSVDAINCMAGNEGDPRQRAAAAIMTELVNYRTDRTSGKAAFPWFLVAMGARQDAVLTGICLSKQCWKQEFRKSGTEKALVDDGTGVHVEQSRDTYALDVDRPDMLLVPPENVVIDASADWTNPAQEAQFIILKWPMQMEEIKAKQTAPINPWNDVPESVLKTASQSGRFDTSAIRRAREMGLDRLDETQTGTTFQIIWVYEVFMRYGGEDWTFYSVGDRAYLTDPRPTREVYPEQGGERPLALGFGGLEAHRLYPMAPAESWQQLQIETNELRNLMLDAIKQNVMPITRVVRGKQVDLEQVRRRSSGSAIMVTNKDDVTWETPPQIPQSIVAMGRELDLELDDLAGQQNFGNVENNNALGKTLGGLKLAAGAANAVQEFDIRVWIETWATPALTQIVRLEQYYESDAIVLGLCGDRAKLFQKHGISKIDDDLLEQEVTVRISVGLGAGDPQQRLAKFQAAAQIVAPLLASAPEFQSGQREINAEAVIEEVFGAAGYKDSGARFFRDNGQPKQNPMGDLQQQAVQAKIERDRASGKASMMQGLAAVAKVALGKKELEAAVVNDLLGHQAQAHSRGFDDAHRHMDQHLKAMDHGHRHGLAIANHRHMTEQAAREAALSQVGGDAEMGGSALPPSTESPSAGPPGPPSASPPPEQTQQPQPQQQAGPNEALMQLLREGKLTFTRGKDGRINGLALPQQQGGQQAYPAPAA